MKKIIISLLLLGSMLVLTGCDLLVFSPEGPQARSILGLINFSIVMMAIVVAVVFVLFGWIVWKYREKPENKDYEPEEEKGSIALEITWTVIPLLIVIALTIPTVIVTFAVEDVPAGFEDVEPIEIHVTAADWKWIFSYPEEDIQTVNYVNIPIDTPILFRLTSASTMQSFWVPQLGGQKYAMANMENELYLLAERPGTFMGRNTNFNGQGYAHMTFEVVAQTRQDYDSWVQDVKETAPELTQEKYMHILYPGHLGRMTFNGTHLQWVNHADPNAQIFLHSETYRHFYYTQGLGYERQYNTILPRDPDQQHTHGHGHSGNEGDQAHQNHGHSNNDGAQSHRHGDQTEKKSIDDTTHQHDSHSGDDQAHQHGNSDGRTSKNNSAEDNRTSAQHHNLLSFTSKQQNLQTSPFFKGNLQSVATAFFSAQQQTGPNILGQLQSVTTSFSSAQLLTNQEGGHFYGQSVTV